jgi:hypothetical protein
MTLRFLWSFLACRMRFLRLDLPGMTGLIPSWRETHRCRGLLSKAHQMPLMRGELSKGSARSSLMLGIRLTVDGIAGRAGRHPRPSILVDDRLDFAVAAPIVLRQARNESPIAPPAHRSQAVSRRIAATISFSGPAKESLIADLPRKRSKSAPGVVPTPVASSSLAQKSAESSLNREILT